MLDMLGGGSLVAAPTDPSDWSSLVFSDWPSRGLHRNSLLYKRVHERHSAERRQGSAAREEREIRGERRLAHKEPQADIARPDPHQRQDPHHSRQAARVRSPHTPPQKGGRSDPPTTAAGPSTEPNTRPGADQEPASTPDRDATGTLPGPDQEPAAACIVCFERVAANAHSGRCADFFAGHVLCRACCIGHVTAQTDPLTGIDTLRAQGRADGSVKCPAAGCDCMWDPATIARLVPADLFERACELRMRVREHSVYAKAQAQLEEEVAKINELLVQERSWLRVSASRQLLVEQLQRQVPNARQCGGCGFGPIDHGWCDDLRAHHGEARGGGARISNSCPRCGWFRQSAREWPRWTGELPEEAAHEELPAPAAEPRGDRQAQAQPHHQRWREQQQLATRPQLPLPPPPARPACATIVDAVRREVERERQRVASASYAAGAPLSEAELSRMSEAQRIAYAIQLSLRPQGWPAHVVAQLPRLQR